jgi:anti-sigma B factor antagonist
VELRRAPHQPTPTDVTLVCVGELDTSGWREFRQEVIDCGEVEGTRRVVLDLSDVTFFDSSAIRALIGAREQLLLNEVELRVDKVSPIVTRVLEITGLDAYLVSPDDGGARGSAAAG